MITRADVEKALDQGALDFIKLVFANYEAAPGSTEAAALEHFGTGFRRAFTARVHAQTALDQIIPKDTQ